MFYYYGPNEGRASSLTYSKVLSAASGEAAVVTSHSNPTHVALSAIDAQTVGSGTRSPSKILALADGQHAGLITLKFGLHYLSPAVASAQAAKLVKQYTGIRLLTAQSASATGLSFPRLNHAVVATSQANAGHLKRQTAKWLPVVSFYNNPFSPAFSSDFGGQAGQPTVVALVHSSGRAPNTTSAEAIYLARSPGLIRLAASPDVGNIVRAAGKIVPTVHQQQSASIPKTIGHIGRVAQAAVVLIVRAFPFDISAASGEAAHLGFGGGAYARLFGVATGQALTVQHGLFVMRGTIGPNVARLLRSPMKPLNAATPNLAAAVKTAARLLGAASAAAVGALRTIGLPRSIAAATVVAASPSGSHLPAVLHAVQTQAAAAATALTHSIQALLKWAQTSAASLSSVRFYLRTLSAVQTQALTLGKGIARSLPVATGTLQALLRSTAKMAALVSGSVILLILPRFALRQFATTSATAVALARGASRLRGILSPQALSAARQRGKALSAANAQSSGLGRLINKLLAVLSGQVLISGRGDSKTVRATSPNSAAMTQPRSLFLHAVDTQVGALVTWYHLFVADWGYLQTILFPPAGGPPEPPAFGPIDPADRSDFCFDWSKRANPGDMLVSAVVVSLPSGLPFFGPAFVNGLLVEVTVLPFPPLQPQSGYSLRCTATFASGRRSSMSIPLIVRQL